MSEIFIDSDCSVCNTYGSFLNKRNKNLNISSHQELNKSDFEKDEVIYLKDNIKYYASDAVIESIYDLGGVYKTVIILTLVPLTIRHFVYKVISKNRKRFFYK